LNNQCQILFEKNRIDQPQKEFGFAKWAMDDEQILRVDVVLDHKLENEKLVAQMGLWHQVLVLWLLLHNFVSISVGLQILFI